VETNTATELSSVPKLWQNDDEGASRAIDARRRADASTRTASTPPNAVSAMCLPEDISRRGVRVAGKVDGVSRGARRTRTVTFRIDDHPRRSSRTNDAMRA
jgi:hypothetical protein